MNLKRITKGIKRIATAEIMMLAVTVGMAVPKIMLAGYDVKKVLATVTSDTLNETTRLPLTIAFFALVFMIASAATKLVGVCKAAREVYYFKFTILPVSLMLAAALVIFYLEAAEVESGNPLISGIMRAVSNVSLIVFSFFALRGARMLADEVGNRRALMLGWRFRIPVVICGFVNAVSAGVTSFIDRQILTTKGVVALTAVGAVAAFALYLMLLIVMTELLKALKKLRAEQSMPENSSNSE